MSLYWARQFRSLGSISRAAYRKFSASIRSLPASSNCKNRRAIWRILQANFLATLFGKLSIELKKGWSIRPRNELWAKLFAGRSRS